MKVRVLGGGWYGCHIAAYLRFLGCEVELHEIGSRLFNGASGSNPARLHLGFHYPRSLSTRAACQDHYREFMDAYGHLTRGIPVNVYAVAEHRSVVDFGTYCQVLRGEVQYITVEKPAELGLHKVEGALLTGERHIVIDQARKFFDQTLLDSVKYGVGPLDVEADAYDWTIDCTFCARDGVNIDRYEPCITALLEGPTDRAVTIMDGPFPSIYPWNEAEGLCSLTSALYTPLAKCRTYEGAQAVLAATTVDDTRERVHAMREQIGEFWPASRDLFRPAAPLFGIRAMPLSGADARLVDIVRTSERRLRVRAGKIDSILLAGRLVWAAMQTPGATHAVGSDGTTDHPGGGNSKSLEGTQRRIRY